MRLIVGIRVKNHVSPESREPRFEWVRRAHRALDKIQPWPETNTTHAYQWVPPAGRTAMISRSNEPDSVVARLGWLGNKQRSWAWTGVAHESTIGKMRASAADRAEIDETIWDGVGSYAVIGATPDTLTAYTNANRSEALYWVELDDVVVVSNSAAVLAHMRTNGSIEYSALGFAGFIMHALPLAETLPFAGVQVMPAGSKLLSGGQRDMSIAQDPGDPHFGSLSFDERVDTVAESLVTYAKTLSHNVESVRAAATGGKDSRLVASALRAAGVDFATYTNGLPESGEVHVGRKFSEFLGIKHAFQAPPTKRGKSGSPVIVAKPETQAWQTLRSTGGLGNAYTVLPNPSQNHVSPLLKANFGGQGGEIIRGGYLRLADSDEPAASKTLEIFMKHWMNNRDLLNPLAREAVIADFKPIFDQRLQDPDRPLFTGYIAHRTGRWLATMRHGESVVYPHTTLLINNQMIRRLLTFSTGELRDEKVAHAVMSKLAPGIQDLPFFRDRWGFEQEGPSAGYKPDSWDSREPYTAHEQPRANFNWRAVYSRDLSKYFRDYVMDSPNSLLFDILDRKNVETMFKGKGYRAPTAWALYSAQYTLSNDWLSPHAPTNVATLEIPVPD